jgi:hypothetical protein
MVTSKPIFILLAVFLLPCYLQAQKYTASDFVETQLAKPNSEEWRQLPCKPTVKF